MLGTFRETAGMALVVTSAQNIDRLVTIYRATKRAGRRLLMDPYTADIANATGYDTIPRPHPDWELIHTYMPRWQALRIKQTGGGFSTDWTTSTPIASSNAISPATRRDTSCCSPPRRDLTSRRRVCSTARRAPGRCGPATYGGVRRRAS